MRSCIITFNIHNICFVGWRDSLLVLFVICSNYAFPLIKKKNHKTHKKTSNTRCHVIIPIVYETHRKTTCFLKYFNIKQFYQNICYICINHFFGNPKRHWYSESISATDMQSAKELLVICQRIQILVCPSGQWTHQKSLNGWKCFY